MQWIVDLLIDKLKKDKTKEWEPQPIWIEEDLPQQPKEKDNKEDQRVIIIDL